MASTGTWGISGNAGYLATAVGSRNVATVSGASDGSFSFRMPVAQAGSGLAFRYADVNNYWRLVQQPGSNSWQLIKRDDGVETTVATAAGACCTASDTLTVVANGPAISVLRNGSQILSINDAALIYGSRVGPFAQTTGAGRIDDLVLSAATVMIDKTGTAHVFRSDGRLARVTDVAGRQLQLNYDTNARLLSVLNVTTNRMLTVGWAGNHVSSVSTQSVAAHSGVLTWAYGYTGSRLTSVTSPHSANPTTYGYAYNGKLGQTILPRGNVETTVGYNLDGTVEWRDDGLGGRTWYENLGGTTTTTIRVTN
nr:hypothetical protein [Micromonospora sp. DSM 115978]